MPTQGLIVEPHNFDELQRALEAAPAEAFRYVKSPVFRFARRVARRVKLEGLSGRPGIAGGPWKRLSDKNVRGFTVGSDLGSLKAVSKASRILRTHIEGATITARGAGYLFLSKKSGKAGAGRVFARVRSVTIPARVPFESIWQAEIPLVGEQVSDALHRAVTVAIERQMKTLTSAALQVIHG
jgi:hypothetical protein